MKVASHWAIRQVDTQPAGYLARTNTVGTVNGATNGTLLAGNKIGSIVLTSGLAGRRPHPGWTIASSISLPPLTEAQPLPRWVNGYAPAMLLALKLKLCAMR